MRIVIFGLFSGAIDRGIIMHLGNRNKINVALENFFLPKGMIFDKIPLQILGLERDGML